MRNNRGMLWIGAITAVAALTIVLVVLAGGKAATAEPLPCWDPGYTGGFSWVSGGTHHYGWHMAHAPGAACTARVHAGGCNCAWCGAHRDATAAKGCPCGWCSATAQGKDAPDGWYAHGPDCGCAWCSANHDWQAKDNAPKGARIGDYAHDAHCGCGWCMGYRQAVADDGSWVDHGHGCCCGWCGTHGNPNGSAPSRHGGCCGCC